jgi:WD40 repeat protein
MSTSWLDGGHFDLLGETAPDQSPSKARFSDPLPDYDVLLAIGYRDHPVLVLDPLEMQLLSVCEMTGASDIDDLVFNNNADIPALAVSYADGRLCIFNYESGRLDFSIPNVYAASLSCSKDGLHLVCGSSQGSISLYEFDRGYDTSMFLTPIYRINALADAIRGLAFHFDGHRFIDITRRQCRVWEPAALVQMADEGASTSDVLSVARKINRDVIAPDPPRISTPLTTSLYGGLVAAANSLGQVVLFSADNGCETGTTYTHTHDAWIRLVALGHLGALIASADDSGRLIVAGLPHSLRETPDSETMAGQDLTSRIIIDRSTEETVSQLLFNPDDTRLLVVSDFMELFELPSGKILKRHRLVIGPSPADFNEDSNTQPAHNTPFVVQHPTKPDCFIVMTGVDSHVFNWAYLGELTPSQGIRLQHPADCALLMPATVIYHSIPGQGVLEHRKPQRGLARLILWPLTAFNPESAACGHHATDHGLEMIGPLVESVLGGMTDNKVAFLDKSMWICSFDLHPPREHGFGSGLGSQSSSSGARPTDESIVSNIRRHFFAMNEWRDGNNSLSCLKIPVPAGPYRNDGFDFAFIARDRVIVIQGGLDFSEVIKVSQGPLAVSKEGHLSQIDDPDALSTPTPQWTVVSGSMHRRALD